MNSAKSSLRQQYLKVTLPLEDRLPIAIFRKKPQLKCEFHQHEGSIELVLITSGTGTHVWKNVEGETKQSQLQAGDVLVLHEKEAHRYVDVSDLELINLVFKPLEQWLPVGELFAIPGYYALFHIEPYIQRAYQIPYNLRLDQEQRGRMERWIEELEEEISEAEMGYEFAAKGILMQLLAFLCRAYPKTSRPDPISRQSRALKGVSHALSYIEGHYSEEISFEKLRTVAKMSHSGLLRAFRHCVGQSPIDYLIHTRINKAKQLLSNSSLNVSEISLRVGFNDPNYFSRKFKALTNTTPRQYRQDMIGQYELEQSA